MRHCMITDMLVNVYHEHTTMKVVVVLKDINNRETYSFKYDPEPFAIGVTSKTYAQCYHYGQKAKADLRKLWNV